VDRAARLPLAAGSTLTVLHVLPPGIPPQDRAGADRALEDAAALAARVVAGKGVEVVARQVEGTPFVEIVRGARQGRSELIVVGRHGRRTFRDLLLGSTAERVIRTGDRSILIVGSPPTPYMRPLVAVDCSETSRHPVELTWRLADPGAPTLELVHAYAGIPDGTIRRAGFSAEESLQYHLDARRNAESAVEAFVRAGDLAGRVRVLVREGDTRQQILQVAWQHDADLVAVGTHGRSGIVHALLGSVAEAIVRGASCDVLVARSAGTSFELP
jgi:nucleotide-binding universal stress UspA family protein